MSKEIYELSDEEFDKLTPEQAREMAKAADAENGKDDEDSESDEDEQGVPQGNDDEDESENEDDSNDQDADQNEDNSDEDSQDDSENEDEDGDDNSEAENVKEAKETKTKKSKTETKKESDGESDADNAQPDATKLKEFHDKVTSTFRAHGAEYNFNNPDEIISLMQKGVDYNSKMNAISKYRAVGELLQQHDLLDPTKLSFAIDLINKKPEAIAKLIQESGIDAYELDEEKAKTYQQTDVDISGKHLALKDVMETYGQDPAFIEIFNDAKTWDDKSQEALISNPHFFHSLVEHHKAGEYHQVMAQVKRKRALGNDNTPVLADYDAIGKQMFQVPNGSPAQANEKATSTPETKVIKKTTTNVDQMRKAASQSTKTSKRTTATKTFEKASDIFSLSDEEFDKITPSLLRGNK